MSDSRQKPPGGKNVISILSVLLIASVSANIWLGTANYKNSHNRYPYLSKRLFAEKPNDVIINFNSLRADLRSYPTDNKIDMGIYFEYMPSGNNIGVNEKEEFFSASLIKVPVVMRAYRLIEVGKLSLSEAVTLDPNDIDKTFGSLWERGAGAKVTIDELIRLSIADSDNTAYNALGRVTDSHTRVGPDTNLIKDVYDYLDLPSDTIGSTYGTTPKNYSSILRSLYLSAYLNFNDSNRLLELMTETSFNKWLPQPLPSDIKVAHKYGVFEGNSKDLTVSSDCGIIYYPQRPYTLCVMIRTDDPLVAEKHIQAVSAKVYNFIKSVNP